MFARCVYKLLYYLSKGQFPYLVSLQYIHEGELNLFPVCGGTIISKTHVLTAAHCFKNDTTMKGLPK